MSQFAKPVTFFDKSIRKGVHQQKKARPTEVSLAFFPSDTPL
jgi:hypothetical protein